MYAVVVVAAAVVYSLNYDSADNLLPFVIHIMLKL